MRGGFDDTSGLPMGDNAAVYRNDVRKLNGLADALRMEDQNYERACSDFFLNLKEEMQEAGLDPNNPDSFPADFLHSIQSDVGDMTKEHVEQTREQREELDRQVGIVEASANNASMSFDSSDYAWRFEIPRKLVTDEDLQKERDDIAKMSEEIATLDNAASVAQQPEGVGLEEMALQEESRLQLLNRDLNVAQQKQQIPAGLGINDATDVMAEMDFAELEADQDRSLDLEQSQDVTPPPFWVANRRAEERQAMEFDGVGESQGMQRESGVADNKDMNRGDVGDLLGDVSPEEREALLTGISAEMDRRGLQQSESQGMQRESGVADNKDMNRGDVGDLLGDVSPEEREALLTGISAEMDRRGLQQSESQGMQRESGVAGSRFGGSSVQLPERSRSDSGSIEPSEDPSASRYDNVRNASSEKDYGGLFDDLDDPEVDDESKKVATRGKKSENTKDGKAGVGRNSDRKVNNGQGPFAGGQRGSPGVTNAAPSSAQSGGGSRSDAGAGSDGDSRSGSKSGISSAEGGMAGLQTVSSFQDLQLKGGNTAVGGAAASPSVADHEGSGGSGGRSEGSDKSEDKDRDTDPDSKSKDSESEDIDLEQKKKEEEEMEEEMEEERKKAEEEERREQAAIKIQKAFRDRRDRIQKAEEEERKKAEEEERREQAAIKIQKAFRDRRDRIQKAEEEERKKAEEEERKKAEEEERKKKEEEEERKKAEEERKKKEEEEERKKKEEEEERKKAEEEERKKAEEEERKKKEEEEERKKAEEERKKKEEEEERKKKAEEERKKKEEEEERKKAEEEERKKAEEEERKKKEEEEERKKAEEEGKKKAEEERKKAEEEGKKKAEEERKKKAEEERKKKAEEERKKAEEEGKKKAEERKRERDDKESKRQEEIRKRQLAVKGDKEKLKQDLLQKEKLGQDRSQKGGGRYNQRGQIIHRDPKGIIDDPLHVDGSKVVDDRLDPKLAAQLGQFSTKKVATYEKIDYDARADERRRERAEKDREQEAKQSEERRQQREQKEKEMKQARENELKKKREEERRKAREEEQRRTRAEQLKREVAERQRQRDADIAAKRGAAKANSGGAVSNTAASIELEKQQKMKQNLGSNPAVDRGGKSDTSFVQQLSSSRGNNPLSKISAADRERVGKITEVIASSQGVGSAVGNAVPPPVQRSQPGMSM